MKPFRYLFFTLCFVLALILFIWIGFRLVPTPSSSEASQPSDTQLPVVILDAGHGGEDGGAVGANGIYEKDLNLSIAKRLEELLRVNGIPVVMTRSEDILLYDPESDYHGQKKVQDLATRRKIAESYDHAVFLSIHMNAFPDPKYSGLQVYYSENDPSSRSLAENIQALSTSLLLPDNHRKIKSGKGSLYLLDRLSCPAVLVECGFLSNGEECERLSAEEYQKELAMTLCLSLLDYLTDGRKNPQDGS